MSKPLKTISYRYRNEDDNTSQNVYHVVGNDRYYEVDEQNGTLNFGGYLFISENLKDSLMTNNHLKYNDLGDLLVGIIDFPITMYYSTSPCGFAYFPKEYRCAFKVQINSYRPTTEEEEWYLDRAIPAICATPTWYKRELAMFQSVVITSISKIQ
jgi:hypothetical protein